MLHIFSIDVQLHLLTAFKESMYMTSVNFFVQSNPVGPKPVGRTIKTAIL